MKTTSLLFCGMLAILPISIARGQGEKTGYDIKRGLSLTAMMNQDSFSPEDEVKISFSLKNHNEGAMYVSDGFLAPDYHEAGPGRHFEVYAFAGSRNPLMFWSGKATEGGASGARRVFALKSGETYEGSIAIRSADEKDPGGSFENKKTRKRHRFGDDAKRYTIQLVYHVNPDSHGVWEPPADFDRGALWTGVLISSPIVIRFE